MSGSGLRPCRSRRMWPPVVRSRRANDSGSDLSWYLNTVDDINPALDLIRDIPELA